MTANIRSVLCGFVSVGLMASGVLATGTCSASTASIDDGVLTISLTTGGKLSDILSAEQTAALTGGTVTNVVTSGNYQLTIDLASAGSYAGDWNIKSGALSVLNPAAIGSGKIRMTARTLYLRGGGTYTNDVVFTASGSCSITFEGGSMYGDVTANQDLKVASETAFNDYGKLTLPGKTFSPSGASIHHYRGAVTAELVSPGWANVTHYFHSSGNAVRTWYASYGCIEFGNANCATNSLLDFGYTESHSKTGNFRGSYYIRADQTIDSVVWPSSHTQKDGAAWGPTKAGHACYFSNNARMTMRATASRLSNTYFGGSGSVCWDPVDDYTLTLTNDRLHTLTGPFIVSNGTLRITGASSFGDLSVLQVAPGARVELATTGVVPVRTVHLDVGATLDIPAGHCVTVGVVRTAGVWMTNGTYSAATAWKTGEGTLVVNAAPTDLISWAQATDGAWSEAANWLPNRLPAADKSTYVAAEGADYTVSLDTNDLAVGKVFVGNDASHTSTVQICTDSYFRNGTFFSVANGGCFLQTAGYVMMTNSTASSPMVSGGGVWRVTGGTNVYKCTDKCPFKIGLGGRVEVLGGRMEARNTEHNYAEALSMQGGTLDVSGSGVFAFPDTSGSPYNLGKGLTLVRERGRLTTGYNLVKGTAALPAQIEVRDQGYFNVSETLILSDAASLDISSSAKTMSLGSTLSLDGKAAPSTLMVRKGAYAEVASYIFQVGSMSASDTLYSTGIVHVAGGFQHWGHAYTWGDRPTTYDGTAIGAAYNSKLSPKAGGVKVRPCYGELNVSGAFTNVYALCSVGIGACATGVVNIDGGEFVNKAAKWPAVIGMGGGAGTMTIRDGGRANLMNGVYVGGMSTNLLVLKSGTGSKYFANLIEADETTALGTLNVLNGSLTTKGLVLGAMGEGTLNIGPAGAVTATEVVLSNHVSSVVTFTLGADKADYGTLNVSGKLKVAPGAKLVVDATAFTGEVGRFPLVRATGGIEGSFADMTVKGNNRIKLRVTANGISAVVQHGLAIIVR